MRMRAIACCMAAVALAAAAPEAAITYAVTSRSIQPGELILVTMTTRTPVDDVQVRAFDRDLTPVRVSATRWRVVVGIDLDTPPGGYDLMMTAGSDQPGPVTHRLVVKPKKFRTRELTVENAFVDPPPEAIARIQEDAERLNHVWASSSAEPLWSGAFIRPVAGAANSAFGSRSIFNGQPRSPHAGADFSSPAGTTVKSPNAGRVALAADLYFSGN